MLASRYRWSAFRDFKILKLVIDESQSSGCERPSERSESPFRTIRDVRFDGYVCETEMHVPSSLGRRGKAGAIMSRTEGDDSCGYHTLQLRTDAEEGASAVRGTKLAYGAAVSRRDAGRPPIRVSGFV
jgi:hypothetical protein